MKGARLSALVCAAMVTTACARQPEPTAVPSAAGLGSAVVREGVVYVPASVGSQGCMLYRIRIPGGRAPTALAYQSLDGVFSYGRPKECVKGDARQ